MRNKFFENKIRNRLLLRQKLKVFLIWLSYMLSSVLIISSMTLPASIHQFATNYLKGIDPYKSFIQYEQTPSNIPFAKYDDLNGNVFYDSNQENYGVTQGGVFNRVSPFTTGFGVYDYEQTYIYFHNYFDVNHLSWPALDNLLVANSYLGNFLITMQLIDKISDLSGNDPETVLIVATFLGTTVQDVADYLHKKVEDVKLPDVIKTVIVQDAPYYLKQKIWNAVPGSSDYDHFALAFGTIPYSSAHDELFTSLNGEYDHKTVQTWALDRNTKLNIPSIKNVLAYSHLDNTIPCIVNSPFASISHLNRNSVFSVNSSYKVGQYYGYLPNENPSTAKKDWHDIDPARIYVSNSPARSWGKPTVFYCLSGLASLNHTYCTDLDNEYRNNKPQIGSESDFFHPYPKSLLEFLVQGNLRIIDKPIKINYQVKDFSADTNGFKIYTNKNFINPILGLENPNLNNLTANGLTSGYNSKLTDSDYPLDFTQFIVYNPFGDYSQLGLQGYTYNPKSPSSDGPGISLDYWNPKSNCNFESSSTGQQEALCYSEIPRSAQSIIYNGFSTSQFKTNFEKLYSIISFVIYIFFILGLVIGTIIIVNTTNNALRDNQRRIASLKMLGYKDKEIIRITIGFYNVLILIAVLLAIPFSIFIMTGFLNIINDTSGLTTSLFLGYWEMPAACFIILGIYLLNYWLNYLVIKKTINIKTLN